MKPVAVRILHVEPRSPGPLVTRLMVGRLAHAERVALAFRALGVADVRIVRHPPDDTPFGARLRELVRSERPAGLVVFGSGSLALASRTDLATLAETAGAEGRVAHTNNRFSSDVIAIADPAALRDLPDLPTDNALPRWLEEVAGFEVRELRSRWRLGVDLDSPLDLVLAGLDRMSSSGGPDTGPVRARLLELASVANDRRAELLVAGRTSATTLRWLERYCEARVRALVEERGLKASSRLALGAPAGPGSIAPARPSRSVLGMVLDREGPAALGSVVRELGDGALVDTRVLLAHRLGADERGWPPAEDRFASDLLLADRIDDPWLRELTGSAATASIPILLGGHTLVGPALRLALRRR